MTDHLDPDWDNTHKCHDPKNHVPEFVRVAWAGFHDYQKKVLWEWAKSLADNENWD